jgi:hypothetical protein
MITAPTAVYVSDMSAWPAYASSLVCALLLACGERPGDPIVAAATTRAEAGESAGGSASPPADSAGGSSAGSASSDGGEAPGDSPGPVGLCGACTSSDACGDANDACIRYQDQSFCGRDCDEQRDCPDGYTCVELANSQLWQCVPQTSCPTPSLAPALDDLRQYTLSRINSERAAQSLAPLSASTCLDDLAQASALDFARTDEPLGKYVKECDPVWPNCACGWSAEAEIAIARYALDWTTAIDRAISSQSGRFTDGFLSSDASDVGIGIWLSGDEAWIALSFR